MSGSRFIFSPIWQYVMTACWMSLAASLALVEDSSVFQSIPGVGGYLAHANSNWRFVMQIMLGIVVVVHIGEALYAAYLAMSSKMSVGDTIMWVLQTSILGVLSLNVLKEQCKGTKKIS